MKLLSITGRVLAIVVGVGATTVIKRQQEGATVSLGSPSGEPKQLASGFIYGIPDNDGNVSTAIPDEFFADINFNSCRAGGAQLPEPNRGWAYSEEEYVGRFMSALSNYRTTRKFDGTFILLTHDAWGADGGLPAEMPYPGDDGDWTSYDNFLTRLISDIRANDMIEGLVIDIWNEPDIDLFWPREQDQYMQLWERAYNTFRTELPECPISGPSSAVAPDVNYDFWTTWTSTASRTETIPDVYSWHNLESDFDPARNLEVFNTLRADNDLPERDIHINEYGGTEEQSPSFSAWYIARFERLGMLGLRANWASGDSLHDNLADLLGKDGGAYYPNGEWQLYKYYAGSMTDERVETSGSADGLFDVFATAGGTADTVKIMAATRGTTDTYDVTVKGLTEVGMPASGSVDIRTLRFDWAGADGEVGDPADAGVESHSYTDDQVTFQVTPETADTAYAFEFQ